MKKNKLTYLGFATVASIMLLTACSETKEEDIDKKESKKKDIELNQIVLESYSAIVSYMPPAELLIDENYFDKPFADDFEMNGLNRANEAKKTLDELIKVNEDELTKESIKIKNDFIKILEVEYEIFALMNENLVEKNKFKDDEVFIKKYTELREKYFEMVLENKKMIDSLYVVQLKGDKVKEKEAKDYMEYTYKLRYDNTRLTFDMAPDDEGFESYIQTQSEYYLRTYLSIHLDGYLMGSVMNQPLPYVNALIFKLEEEMKSDMYKNNRFYKEYIDVYDMELLKHLKKGLEEESLTDEDYSKFFEEFLILTDEKINQVFEENYLTPFYYLSVVHDLEKREMSIDDFYHETFNNLTYNIDG